MQPEIAETIALQALAWIAADEDLMPVFMGASGVTLDELKARAGEPTLLIAVLDFLTMDDAWITRFCDAHQHGYDVPLQARQALPGGEQVHWT